MPHEPPMLRKQLLAWLLLPLLALLAVDTYISSYVALRFSERAYDRSLVETARDISLHLKADGPNVLFALSADARDILLSDLTDRIFFEVTDSNARLHAGEPIPAPLPGPVDSEMFYEATVRGLPVRVVQIVVDADLPAARPAAVIRVAETEIKRNKLAREILISVVAPQAVLIVVALVVAWLGVIHGLAPLERLRRAVAQRSESDRSPMSSAGVPGEVRPLLEATNELLGRLDEAITLQNRFISDAAHQLKTPVAVLKTQLELAMREEDSASKRDALAAAGAGLERISRVVSQLLSLARNEPEASRAVVLAPLDLNALAFEVATAWVPMALKHHIDLGFEGADGPVMVRGDAARLRELLDNLVDNAVRYSPGGGRVTVRVAAAPAPRVLVSDDGPAIPAEDRQRIFERFHRLLGTSAGGSGLGLAIAREIARIHGAAVDLLADAGGAGNTFSVTFPLSAARG
jgi:two-component system sensor histidine kinase TctE